MHRYVLAFLPLVVLGRLPALAAEVAADLRLVPFPKEVQLAEGGLDVAGPLTLEATESLPPLMVRLVLDELALGKLPAPAVAAREEKQPLLVLAAKRGLPVGPVDFPAEGGEEQYALRITPQGAVCQAPNQRGLLYAVQTLRQLIRANRRGNVIPCLAIRDWPSLRWRCFQDDMTRGPSPNLAVLKLQADLGSLLKMNLFTYYMECQFAFRKHPAIGPKDGSLLAEELAALVAYAKPLGVDVLGNQQSFGHFGNILKHPQYAALRETGDVLSPVKEETYALLDDMYSEVCPLVPFPFFNVCCDETYGLGTGPSKSLAEKVGLGGVYVGHIRRVHDLLKEKHGKRMMMWGDIILQHPEHLAKIPKDTIMLTWGYGPAPSFEHQILPFARSGYEFFVCPGVSNWSRILPDFAVATNNIRNFVRDGAKHGALGMLNTDWEDDGESLNSPTWHGDAWGAECSWNASTTTPEQFNRRLGAVLFGEKGDHFGQAIGLLAKTHAMPGMQGMLNRRFWDNDFVPQRSLPVVRPSAERLLGVVRPAIEHLEACKNDAVVHPELLDGLLHGARRMELIGTRMLDGLEATLAYHQACAVPPQEALPLLSKIAALVRKNRDTHAALGDEFARLWRSEAKPYALDWTMNKYAATLKWYDDLGARLAEARRQAEAGRPLPLAEEIGLALPDAFARRSWPHQTRSEPLAAESSWTEPSATHRLGLVLRAGSAERFQLPVELDLALPAQMADKPVRAFAAIAGGPAAEILAQLDASEKPGRTRLTLIVPGPISKAGEAAIQVYLGLSSPPKPLAGAVVLKDGPKGMKWIENDQVRLLLGAQGAHVYRWEVKALANRDLTMPGEASWFGFSDLGGDAREAKNQLVCVARGPALVRFRATDPEGAVKHIGLFGGASWMEVVLNEGVGYYWDFDDPQNFAADGPTPGKYLFSTGKAGAVGRHAEGVAAQVDAPGAHWGVKFCDLSDGRRLAMGLATPETAGRHRIAPGSGAGGVGIEGATEALHFVTFGGLLDGDPKETMSRLAATLNFKQQPVIVLHAVQPRK